MRECKRICGYINDYWLSYLLTENHTVDFFDFLYSPHISVYGHVHRFHVWMQNDVIVQKKCVDKIKEGIQLCLNFDIHF